MNHDSLPARLRALPTKVSEQQVERRLSARGCDVLFVTADAGLEHPMHQHDTHNLTGIVSGEMTLVTEDGEQKVGPAEWYETRPGEMHGVRFDADTVSIELRFADSPQR
jgi:quercetin dioxygenase-like cupin family protein